MYKINNSICTHGLDLSINSDGTYNINDDGYQGEYGYIENRSKLKTGHIIEYDNDKWIIVDCRNISDSPDVVSDTNIYQDHILEACVYLELNNKVVICCSAGQSRSSAICIGVLIKWFKMDFYDAYDLVRKNNPICNIAPQHLDKIKYIFNVTIP